MDDEQTPTQPDWLGLTDPDVARAAIGPGLIVPSECGPRELEARELMHRMQAPGCDFANLIYFEENDDAEAQAKELLHWQTLLKLPRLPTPDEIIAIKVSRKARLRAAWWDRLRIAAEQDLTEGWRPSSPADKRSL